MYKRQLHITIGLRSLSVGDVVLRAFRRESLLDPGMREIALLDDYSEEAARERAKAVLARVLENLDIEAAANEVYKSFIRSRQPPARGMLMSAIDDAELLHGDRMRVRPGALFQTFPDGNGISLAVDGTVVKFPPGVERAFDYIRGGAEFTPSALPGLEHESKLIFAKALLGSRLVERIG